MGINSTRFFIDFDGTITKNDIVDLILDRFASNDWKKVEAEWVQGKIGSRECLTRQIALVSATKEDIIRLTAKAEIDSHFVSFLRRAKACGISVAIVSDGFRVVIEEVLKRALKASPELLHRLPIFSNQLEWANGLLSVCFPEGPACEHACANCKSRVIEDHRTPDQKIIFIGDGLSDRFAAAASDLTFAKGGANGRSPLLKFCEENKINHEKYSSFKEIETWLIRHSDRSEESKKRDPSSASGVLRMTRSAGRYVVERN